MARDSKSRLDTGIASFKLEEGLIFLDGNNTRAWKKQIQSVPSGEEIGTVIPDDEDSTWIAIFEYTDSGYIEDSEKDNIDADALLIRKARKKIIRKRIRAWV